MRLRQAPLMFNFLKKLFCGELIEVTVLEELDGINTTDNVHIGADLTLVQLPNNERRYVCGHLGEPGDTIVVNTYDLYKATDF